jgi:ABC-type multidrug transport system fused ATPase/permease subunit
MLLGNAVSGVSLAASLLLTGLVERKTEVEALLALGARPAQAARTLFAEATRTGFMPTLNSMLVIGLVSIPGMMTGQILGGAPIWQAALYQMFIMYLIAATCFFAIFLTLSVIQARAFGRSGCLVASRVFFPRAKPAPSGGTRAGLGKFGADCTALLCGGGRTRSGGAAAGGIGGPAAEPLLDARPGRAEPGALGFAVVGGGPGGSDDVVLRVKDFAYGHALGGKHRETGRGNAFTPLAATVELELRAGQIAIVRGANGAGKTTFLRALAQLHEGFSGELELSGRKMGDFLPEEWRRCVRFVLSSRVDGVLRNIGV